MSIKARTQHFRDQIAALPREDILEIITMQNPDLIMQIERCEFVFEHNLRHLTWDDGSPIEGRKFTNEDLSLLVDEPFEYSTELAEMGLSLQHQQKLHIAKDPVTWAKNFLVLDDAPVEPRVYQILMLRHPNRFKVLRAGRRLGKTFTMALLLLWYSYTTKNGRAIVLTPMQAQANLIYEEILKIVKESEVIQESIGRTVASPPAEIDFENGSTIRFFTSGMKSGGRSDATRGQEAHLIVLDELDYMGDEDLEAVLAMMQKTGKNQPEKVLIGASTPSGKRAIFWKWCHDSRFKEFWFPSYCNPFWSQEDEDFLHEQHKTEMGYRHEVEADWGELTEGVYPRRLVDLAFNTVDDYEYVPGMTNVDSSYVIGVDWDKYGAGTNIVVLELYNNKHPETFMRGKVRVCHREETTREGYSLLTAVDRIIELNKNFNPDWIYVDRGYGDTQVELLHRHGVDNPHTKLNTKVKGIQFAQTIEVRDPFTMEKVKKEIKPFMVATVREMLEQERIVFPAGDKLLYDQMTHYIVTRTTISGRPVYEMANSDLGDHAHDALMLACLAVTQNYDKLFRVNYATKSYATSNSTFMGAKPLSPNENKAKQQVEQAKKEYSSISAAPIQLRRSMTGNSRRGTRPIKRRTF